MTAPQPLLEHARAILDQLGQREQILLALDYDGTLAPIVSNPRDAATPQETADTIARLGASTRYRLAIVSGRSLADLRGRAPAGAILVGNHGLEIEGGSISYVHEEAAAARQHVARAADEVERALGGASGTFVERKGLSATAHYRNSPPDLVPRIKETVRAAAAIHANAVFVKSAAKALELRPRVHWNKGLAVCLLLGHMEAPDPGLLTAGDDSTDEDMFGLTPHEVSIKVGDAHVTRARYHARNAEELASFLAQL